MDEASRLRWRAVRWASCAIGAGSLLMGPAAQGSLINFDPDGAAATNGTIKAATFAFLPGSSLLQDTSHFHDTLAQFPVGSTFDFNFYIQSRLGNLLDATNTPVAVTGFNAANGFELTAVSHFTATATRTSASKFSISLAAAQTNNFFEIYYDPNSSTRANDLAGTGFNDVGSGAKQILSAHIVSMPATNNVTVDSSTIDLFDQYDADGDNYGGLKSIFAGGNLKIDTAIDSVDSTFFKDSLSTFTFNTSLQTPYTSVDPAAAFSGLPGGNNASVSPDFGSGAQSSKINGSTGTGLEEQVYGNGTFQLVPEPASLLSVAGLVGGVLLPRWRSRKSQR